MTNKICTKCKKSLGIDQFSFKNKKAGKRASACKPCHVIYLRKHYQDKRDMYLANSRKQNIKLRTINLSNLMEYLKDHPCVDCGETDPIVLEFDHVKDKKEDTISHMLRRYVWQKIKKEIQKCDVRCANCHKRKTAKDFNWRKTNWPVV